MHFVKSVKHKNPTMKQLALKDLNSIRQEYISYINSLLDGISKFSN